jgi:hypothetical protein
MEFSIGAIGISVYHRDDIGHSVLHSFRILEGHGVFHAIRSPGDSPSIEDNTVFV